MFAPFEQIWDILVLRHLVMTLSPSNLWQKEMKILSPSPPPQNPGSGGAREDTRAATRKGDFHTSRRHPGFQSRVLPAAG